MYLVFDWDARPYENVGFLSQPRKRRLEVLKNVVEPQDHSPLVSLHMLLAMLLCVQYAPNFEWQLWDGWARSKDNSCNHVTL